MKLPWDSKYLKISFHVIFTLFIAVILWITASNIILIVKALLRILGNTFSILAPLWIGIIIAYLLDPLADYFQRKYETIIQKNQIKINSFKGRIGVKNNKKEQSRYKSRGMGATIVYILVIVVIIVLGIFISASLGTSGNTSDIDNIIIQATQTLDNFSDFLTRMQITLTELKIFEQSDQIIKEIIGNITSFTQSLGNQIISSVSKIGVYVVNFVIGVVIGFYFIKDKYMIIDKTREFSEIFISKRINFRIRTILSDIDAIFSGYIRGQLTDAAIMATMIAISLSIIGIDFAVLIGIISGFSNVIPYIGAFVGLALAVIVGLLSGTPVKALIALVTILILQQIDNAIIAPKVVGNQVNLHPILLILALAVGGAVFGIGGMIFAVPVTAILKIFLLRYMERKKQSKKC